MMSTFVRSIWTTPSEAWALGGCLRWVHKHGRPGYRGGTPSQPEEVSKRSGAGLYWGAAAPLPHDSAPLGLPQLPRSLSRHAVLPTPADRTGALVGCFPARAAFPVSQAGRHPRLHSRGLLKLHSRYGLPVCSPTIRGLCHEASIRSVTRLNRSLAKEARRNNLTDINSIPCVLRLQ